MRFGIFYEHDLPWPWEPGSEHRLPWPRPASARAGSASGTASSSSRRGVDHPAREAERIATLDLISDGRVDFGTGESSSPAELGGFLVDRDRRRAGLDPGERRAPPTPRR